MVAVGALMAIAIALAIYGARREARGRPAPKGVRPPWHLLGATGLIVVVILLFGFATNSAPVGALIGTTAAMMFSPLVLIGAIIVGISVKDARIVTATAGAGAIIYGGALGDALVGAAVFLAGIIIAAIAALAQWLFIRVENA